MVMATVLIIDDDKAVRLALQSALEGMGHAVDVSGNGIEGIAVCNVKDFDLVITDLIMPGKDGVETILELKIGNPDLRIIAISGADNNLDIMDTAYRVGADCALTKPFSMSDLADCVNRVLDGSYAV